MSANDNSTATQTNDEIRRQITDLIALVQQGRIVDAIERFYDDDVTMQENLSPATVGKHANLAREAGFQGWVANWQRVQAPAVLVDGDRAVIHWDLEYTSTDGHRWRFDQLAIQRWKNGRIVEERFVYDPATTQLG